jgi:Fe-S-cluster-containing dehydrogenase component
MAKRLFIDLEKCRKCKECPVTCSYYYHPGNNGVLALREFATYAVICRQCEEAGCVNACPKEALEKQEDGTLKRYNMRCVSCKSCGIACPFGTILPELLPFYNSACDYCLGRAQEAGTPDCVGSCPEKAIEFREVSEEPDKNIFLIGEHLAVYAVNFRDKLARELNPK